MGQELKNQKAESDSKAMPPPTGTPNKRKRKALANQSAEDSQ